MTPLSKATTNVFHQQVEEMKQLKEIAYDHPFQATMFFEYVRDYARLPIVVSFDKSKTYFRLAVRELKRK